MQDSDAIGDTVGPSTIDVWLDMLKNYSVRQVSRAFMQLRGEGREFAPNVSQFEAILKRNDEDDAIQRAQHALLAKRPVIGDGIVRVMRETKVYKDKLGLWVTQPREYCELTQEAAGAGEARMLAEGLRKRPIDLPGGRKGFTWERFRAPTVDELEEASRSSGSLHEKPWRKDLPTPDERAKPTGVTSDGQRLDESFEWASVFDVLDSVDPARKPNPLTQKLRDTAQALSSPETPPDLPPEVLRSQERDSGPTRNAPPGEHPWPWRDEDLYSPTEERLTSLEDALGPDFEF